MGIVRADVSLSLDGYVAGPSPTAEEPLGRGGEALHAWAVATRVWRHAHGLEGGEDTPDGAVLEAVTRGVGAEVMGRGKFGPPGGGPWGEPAWRGWWGDEPPFGMPVVVLTHHPREPLVLGSTTFTFVTGGVEEALARAREAAGDRDVLVGGGADVIDQVLAAGLLDELHLHVVPVVLGGGPRLLAGVRPPVRLEQLRVLEASGVAHLSYRVLR